MKSCVINLTKIISAASQTVATARIAPEICRFQPPTMCSQCPRFHPNRFTFGGVIAEGVNTVFCPYSICIGSRSLQQACMLVCRRVGGRLGSGSATGRVRRPLHRRRCQLQLRRVLRRSAGRVPCRRTRQARDCRHAAAEHLSLCRSVTRHYPSLCQTQ